MYNIILYNNYSNKIQIKGDLQMRLTEEQIDMIDEIQKSIDEKVDIIYDLKKLRFQISEAHNLYEIIEGLWNSDMAEEFEEKKQELDDKIDELEVELEELENEIEDIKEGSNSEWQNREYESQLL